MTRTNRPLAPETLAAQALHYLDAATGAVAPPIHPSARSCAMPTTNSDRLQLLPLREPDQRIWRNEWSSAAGGRRRLRLFGRPCRHRRGVRDGAAGRPCGGAASIMYFGALMWLKRLAQHKGITLEQFDQADIGALARAVKPGRTRLVWLETPANPTFEVVDIAAAAEDRPRRRRRARRRRHLRAALHPARPGTRRRHRRPLGHQVPQRPFRHHRRRRHLHRARRPVRGDALRPQAARRGARRLRGVAAGARHAHAVRPL